MVFVILPLPVLKVLNQRSQAVEIAFYNASCKEAEQRSPDSILEPMFVDDLQG
ncbi:hypothetical protein C5167_011544 [Papaver somniferum]|uniref:Uncharacterized protein n=1 Tax=Papaver somniferum TaxID=3469 RepID=A0A4Y7K3A2_PAPSO|nr:hypothetical protein C5167_011544 [Papaver somniferum]